MSTTPFEPLLHLGLPKGRMQDGVFALLADAGIKIHMGARNYRPVLSLSHIEAKLLKPQNIVEMLHAGSRDIGFAGADWVAEKGAELVELLDTQLNPVRVIAAAPRDLLIHGALPDRHLVIASEYETLTRRWIADEGLDATFVRTYGATEVFPPEDADCIVDNTATGSTLNANQLDIVGELMTSSTRLYANPRSLDDPQKRAAIDDLVLVLRSVLDARVRVMVEVNVTAEHMASVLEILPCMREPTVSELRGGGGYAVRVAVRRDQLPTLIPEVKARGGTDIIVSRVNQIVL